MNPITKEVVVVGGGISGLTLSWHLHRAGVDLALIEASDGVGGCTRTELRDGFVLEKGPFNVMVRDPAFEGLLDSVADEVGVVTASPAARKRYIYRRGRLMCVPTNPVALLTTPMLSLGGKFGLMTGLMLSGRARDEEETIEQVAIRRFGKDVSDTMISAVIAGIFAGDIRKLSLKACFPPVADVDRQARSLIGYGLKKAFGPKKKRHKKKYKGLVSIDGGLGALTDALGRSLGSDLLVNSKVEAIRQVDDGYEVDYRDGEGNSTTIKCRHLVMSSPAPETSRLISPLVAGAGTILDSIESSSLVVLNLGFKKSDVGHPMEGYGFLVPHHETEFPLMGVLWADSIFPHHAPDDSRLIRVFIGGARNPGAVERTDDDLVSTSLDSLRGLLDVSGEPTLIDICRYSAAIPQYHRGHTEKIEKLRGLVATKPGLHLNGNYLDGVSLNDCVRSASELATKLIAAVSRAGAEAVGSGAV